VTDMADPAPDVRLLFLTRALRLFAYGFLSVIFVLYLAELGWSDPEIGLLVTMTLLGDTAISLWITTNADRMGRKRMLVAGAGLMGVGGLVFALSNNFAVLLAAATIGVLSPSGNEVGPFLAIEQAALSETVAAKQRTRTLAWYHLTGSLGTALGALACGLTVQVLSDRFLTRIESFRVILFAYAGVGFVLALLFLRLSRAAETPSKSGPPADVTAVRVRLGLHKSLGKVLKLSGLYALDAFAGGFVLQSFLAYWFYVRFQADPALLGGIFFGANVLGGVSALVAARIALRVGLIRTMVFTHVPSNVLLMLVPLMPTLPLAVFVLLLRFAISQMDVPSRQSYTVAVVNPDERSAAAGVTGVARTTGAALSPVLAGLMFADAAWTGAPFIVAGLLKLLYDAMLYRSFRHARPPEELP
jgi:MFS family permease